MRCTIERAVVVLRFYAHFETRWFDLLKWFVYINDKECKMGVIATGKRRKEGMLLSTSEVSVYTYS